MLAITLFFSVLGLTAIAAYKDILTYTIPNWISLLLLCVFPLFSLASSMSLTVFGLHFFVGGVALVITMGLYALKVIGGGDAKLFSALALWFGWNDIGMFVFYLAIIGLILVVFLVALRNIPALSKESRPEWVRKLFGKKNPVPYGIALSITSYIIFPISYNFKYLIDQMII